MELKDSKTLINLVRAFAGECQAGARYQFMRQQANNEGNTYVGKILKTLATNEMAHAKEYYEFISSANVPNVDITAGYPFKEGAFLDMLKFSKENESSEATNIYPMFAKIAKEEGFKAISDKFTLISEIENCHSMLLDEIYQKMKSGKNYKSATPIKWKCSNCGHEYTAKTPWETCPVCHFPQGAVEFKLGDN